MKESFRHMNESIFDDEEHRILREKCKKEKDSVSLEYLLDQESRRENIREAFDRIKADVETHKLLLDAFEEPVGFILYLTDYTYTRERTYIDREEPPYISLEWLLSEMKIPFTRDRPTLYGTKFGLYLRTDKNAKKAGLFLGQMHKHSGETSVDIFLPDPENKSQHPENKDPMKVNAEDYAIKMLAAKAILEMHSMPINFDRKRKWFHGEPHLDKHEGREKPNYPGDISNPISEEEFERRPHERRELISRVQGEDLIIFYKCAVRKALWCQKELDWLYKSGKLPFPYDHFPLGFKFLSIDDVDFRLAKRDHYPMKYIPTKISGFRPTVFPER